jgi:hypothetical protein
MTMFDVGADGDTEQVEIELEVEMLGEEGQRKRLGRGFLVTYDCLGCNVSYQFLIPWAQVKNIAIRQPIHVGGASAQMTQHGYVLRKVCTKCMGQYGEWSDQQQHAEATTIIDLTPYIPQMVKTLRGLQTRGRRG